LNGPGIATTLRLELRRGIEAEGEWSCPKPSKTPDGQMAYEGKLEFRRKLRAGAGASPGPIEMACELGFLNTADRAAADAILEDAWPVGHIPIEFLYKYFLHICGPPE
jgi:hypothetical protein